MRQRPAKRLAFTVFALGAATGLSGAGCSDGVPSGRNGDKFDGDDIKVTLVACASKKNSGATVKVTADTSPRDRTYFVGVDFLDSGGDVVDTSARKLTPEPESPDDEKITANVELPMSEPEKAAEVASCEMDHAF